MKANPLYTSGVPKITSYASTTKPVFKETTRPTARSTSNSTLTKTRNENYSSSTPAPTRNSLAPSASRALKRTTRTNATKSANRTQPARVEAISTSTARKPDQPTSQVQSISSELTLISNDSISFSDHGARFCRSKNHPLLKSATYSTPTTSALAPATKKIKLARNEMLENPESKLSA
ncbi:hypothetical protein HK098_006664 [Nowakowskiella sp. JEL0407]|nr:hypothetical protein HK098_006664 [Nowakowskiella sp. JEL0407]